MITYSKFDHNNRVVESYMQTHSKNSYLDRCIVDIADSKLYILSIEQPFHNYFHSKYN